MLVATVIIVNRLGLHARAAAQVVRFAGRFKSRIKLIRDDNSVIADAKSILSVLTLAAAAGTELRIEAEGEDDSEALAGLQKLFDEGFGEL